MKSSFKENIFASILAIFFAFLIVFWINNSEILLMSISRPVADANLVDFILKNNQEEFSLISNKDIQGLQLIFVRFDKIVDPKNINSNYDYLVEQLDGNTNVMFIVKSLKKWEKLFKVTSWWDIKIQSIKLMFTDWNLDEVLFK